MCKLPEIVQKGKKKNEPPRNEFMVGEVQKILGKNYSQSGKKCMM